MEQPTSNDKYVQIDEKASVNKVCFELMLEQSEVLHFVQGLQEVNSKQGLPKLTGQ